MKAVLFSACCEFFLWGIIVAGFLLMAVQHLDLPGPDENELMFPAHALAFLRGEVQPNLLLFHKTYLSLGGHPLPLFLVTGPTPHGPLKVFLFIPVIAWWGTNLFVYRSVTILLGVCILGFTYLLARRMMSSVPLALGATALLASDPTFVFFMRVDNSQVTPIMLCAVAGMDFLARWYATRARWNLWLGAFLFGLALWSRLHFLWFLLAMGCASVIVYARVWRPLVRTQWKLLGSGVLAFLLGCAPLIVYLAATRASPFRELATVFSHTDASIDNRQVLPNLIYQLRHFFNMLNGQSLMMDYTNLPGVGNFAARIDWLMSLLPLLFCVSLLTAIYQVWRRNPAPQWRQIIFFGLAIAGMLVLSIFTSSGFHTYNLAVILPLPHLIVGLAGAGMMRSDSSAARRFGAARPLAIWLAGALALALNLNTVHLYYAEMMRVGSAMKNSPAIYALAECVNRQGAGKLIVLMDWGIGRSVYALTTTHWEGDEAWLRLLYATAYDPSWDATFTHPDAWYVFRARRYSLLNEWLGRDGPRLAFDLIAAEKHWRPELITTVRQPNGEDFYEIYTLTPDERIPVSPGY